MLQTSPALVVGPQGGGRGRRAVLGCCALCGHLCPSCVLQPSGGATSGAERKVEAPVHLPHPKGKLSSPEKEGDAHRVVTTQIQSCFLEPAPFSQVGPVCPQLLSLSSPPIRLFRGTSPALTRELLQNRRCWAGLLASTAWPAPEPRRYRAGQWPLEP